MGGGVVESLGSRGGVLDADVPSRFRFNSSILRLEEADDRARRVVAGLGREMVEERRGDTATPVRLRHMDRDAEIEAA